MMAVKKNQEGVLMEQKRLLEVKGRPKYTYPCMFFHNVISDPFLLVG